MKKIINKTSMLLVLASLTASCSQFSKQEISTDSMREIAAEKSNCVTLTRKILSRDPSTGVIKPIDVERTYTIKATSDTQFRQAQLEQLERKYEHIDSLLDDLSKATPKIKDQVKFVEKAEDGLLAKVMLIRKAKKTIDLTYFLFDDSDAPQVLLHELRMAAQRGVKIRIMYDPVGSKMGTPTPRVGIPEDLKALASLKGKPIVDSQGNPTGKFANIEIVQFNPMWTPTKIIKKWYVASTNLFKPEHERLAVDQTAWNNRIHDKILLIDGDDPVNSYLMTGGRNLNDSYYHLNHSFDDTSTEPTTDLEVIVKGSTFVDENGKTTNNFLDQYNRIFYAAANLNITHYTSRVNREIFKELEDGDQRSAGKLIEMRKAARAEFKRLRASHRKVLGYKRTDAQGNEIFDEGLFSQRLKELEEMDYLNSDFENATYRMVHEVHNLTGKPTLLKPFALGAKENTNSIEKIVFEELLQAKDRIDIVSPYFWIDEKQTMQLVEWLKVDPKRKITVVSNSFLSTDNLISQVVVEDAFETMNKLFQKHGVLEQTDLRVIGKEDDELLEKVGGKEYGFLHAKVYSADQKSAIVSTSNLDPISRITNSEVGVHIVFPDEAVKNKKKLVDFIDFTKSLSTNVNSDEYKRMLADPDASTMLKKLKIYKFLARNLGLLHLL